jgi:CPA2 family monovalent cation:H+ antiporter-2
MPEAFPLLFLSGTLLLFLFAFGYFSSQIRVPGIVLYIVFGVVIGGFISDNHLIHMAGEVGIVLLFFLLGLEFNVNRLVQIGKNVWPAGSLDFILNFIVSAGICLWFGMDLVTSLLIGGVIYATSSSITAKMLETGKRIANAESEFILALLIFEDIVAPVMIAVLIALSAGEPVTGFTFAILLGKVVVLAVIAIILGKILFRKLHTFMIQINGEDYYVLLTVGIALTYAGFAIYLGLSEILGAFLAGMMLSEVKQTQEIEQKVLPIRDLLLPLFFVYFGTTVVFGQGIPYVWLLIVLVLWSLIAKIGTGWIGGIWFGLSRRASLRAGLSITARGEFSVVIATMAAGAVKLFASVYILATALLGILLFQAAPAIAKRVYGSVKKKLGD